MPARRTQIYLDDSLRRRIDRVRAERGETMADVIREALEAYLARRERVTRPLADAAHAWVGAWDDRDVSDDARSGLEERARRLGY